ncbi:MAG: NTP transferase domain-containing protein [Nanoarchaeota archaeon]
MNYKVIILAGGIGSRMGEFSKYYNKVLIPVQGKPTICHIIEKFPEDVEIIISLNYKKEDLKTFLTYAYPTRKITFVEDKPSPEGFKGPGYGMLQCKDHLQCPFVFLSGDTLVKEPIPEPNENWFGLAEVPDTTRFCSAKLDERLNIVRIDDKVRVEGNLAFIGLAGVRDYEHFWNALENNKNIIAGEIQVSNGFKSLLEKNMVAKIFTWFDTGAPIAYKHALENYPDGTGYKGE